MRKNIYILLLLFVSCTNPKNQEVTQSQKDLNQMSLEEILEVPITFSDKEYTLEKVKEINIPIDSVSSNFSAYPIYHDADTAQHYIQGNEAINSIDFYDLEKKQLYKRVIFERTGNNMISSTRKLFIQNADSIYIFEDRYGRINLVNIEGKILQRYSFPKEHIMNVESGLSINFYVKDSKAYFKCSPYLNGVENAGGQKMIAIFDLVQRDLKYVPAHAPSYLSTTEKNPIVIRNGVLFHDNKYISIFGLTGHIHYGEVGKEEYNQIRIEKKDSQSNSKKNFTATSEEEKMSLDNYFHLIYDNNLKLYYIVVLDGIEPVNPVTGETNSVDNQTITIVIADENFHHAGEYTLPKDTHFRNIMVTKEGLLVSNANPKNPNNDEGVLSFTLYKPKQIK